MRITTALRYLLPRPDDEDEWVLRRAWARQEKKQAECQHPPNELAFSIVAHRFYCRICEKWI